MSPSGIRGLVLLGLASCAAFAAGCGNGDASAAKGPAREPTKPQVRVAPKAGPPGTVFVFMGRGWRPHFRMEAIYGEYCPGSECDSIGYATRIVPDKDGRFTFRFREGPRDMARDLRPPAAAGGGPVIFEQFAGREYHSRLVRRTPRYRVDR